MIPEKCIWIFNGHHNQFPSGVFSTRDNAETWIKQHNLTGTLTAYPFDEGAFRWSLRNDMLNLKPEKIKSKSTDADFIGNFSNISFEHYHFEMGKVK